MSALSPFFASDSGTQLSGLLSDTVPHTGLTQFWASFLVTGWHKSMVQGQLNISGALRGLHISLMHVFLKQPRNTALPCVHTMLTRSCSVHLVKDAAAHTVSFTIMPVFPTFWAHGFSGQGMYFFQSAVEYLSQRLFLYFVKNISFSCRTANLCAIPAKALHKYAASGKIGKYARTALRPAAQAWLHGS